MPMHNSNLETFVTPPENLEKLLLAHLPASLTLLRKVQYLRRRASTSKARFPQILLASSSSSPWSSADGASVAGSDGQAPASQSLPASFTLAYINTTVAQSTSMYLYSTLQDRDDDDDQVESDGAIVTETESQLEAILHALIRLRRALQDDMQTELPASVVLGSLHSRIRGLWEKTGRIMPRPSGQYDKWLFDVDKLPHLDESLPQGMVWGSGSLQDCQVVASRTDIPRPVQYLLQMPSLFIKLLDGTPISWAFLDSVGSLISVHCEEPYRNRGLARKISSKLLREKVDWFGPGGLSSADVAPDNAASRAMCKSLNGYPTYSVSWVTLDLRDSMPPA